MLFTYNVFNDLERFRNVVDSFFNEVPARYAGRLDYPLVNAFEKDDRIELHALLPGVKAEDLKVEVVNKTLVIEGERKNDRTEQAYLRRERTFGSFRKAVELPYRVDRNNITATLKDGVLTIALVKSEDARPKRIAIE